jgi:hypothetical protein
MLLLLLLLLMAAGLFFVAAACLFFMAACLFMAAGSFSQWLWFKRFQDLSQILDLSPDGNGQAREQPRGR